MGNKISNTTNRADKLLLKEYIMYLYKKTKFINTVDGHNKYLIKWEKEISNFLGLKDSLLTNSGTDALQLALLSLNLKKGDKVIVPAVTYLSVALAVHYAGVKIVPVDISEENMLMDLNKLKQLKVSEVKAIIAIHMFGHTCEMDKVMKLANQKKIVVIENACQALGTSYRGKLVGGFGHLGAMSFRYAKTISSFSGNGGALLFSDKRYDKEKIKRNFMEIFKGQQGLFELKSKLHPISFFDALTAMVKLKHFDEIAAKKRICRQIYTDKLKQLPEVTIFPDGKNSDSIRPFYFILASKRNSLITYLYKQGIECEAAYPPLTEFNQLGRFNKKLFPVAYKQWNYGIRLPLFDYMKSEEVNFVVDKIKEFYLKKR